MTWLKVVLWILAVLTLGYLLPTAIAYQRRHTNTLAIFLLDFFLGWTLLGWVAALVWSALKQPPTVVIQSAPAIAAQPAGSSQQQPPANAGLKLHATLRTTCTLGAIRAHCA